MTIAAFEEEDREALSILYDRMRVETFTWLNADQITLGSFDADTANEKILVAKYGEKVAGFVSLWEPDFFIHHLYVDTDFQGRGIGQKLLAAILESVRGVASLKCLENNQKAVRFYTKNGWEKSLTGKSEHGNYILFELAK